MVFESSAARGLPYNAEEVLNVVLRTQASKAKDARAALGLGESAFETAVEDLVERRLVRRLRVGRHAHLFPYSEEVELWGPQVVALRDWRLHELYDLVKEMDLPLVSEVVARAKASWEWEEPTTEWWLSRLEHAHLVTIVCLGNEPNRRRAQPLPFHPLANKILNGAEGSSDPDK